MNRGFTLIEIIIVIAIFSVVISMVSSTVFLSSKVYFQGERMTEIMQNGRVILDAISRELRQARKLVNLLPEEDPPSEIIFQDGHIETIKESGFAEGGEGSVIILSSNSSLEDGFYEDAFIKIANGEVRKIISYNGEEREATLNLPFDDIINYFGEEYFIDTSYYYIRYFLDDGGLIKREVYTYYFSGDENYYIPYNAVPPSGETLEKETLESAQVVGEHFESISFWEDDGVNIFVSLKIGRTEINLLKKVFGRNL